MKMKKRAQITLYLIIGIIILTISIFLIYRLNQEKKVEMSRNLFLPEKEVFKNYILLCIKETFNNAKTYHGITNSSILENYIYDNLDSCIDDEIFHQYGYEIVKKEKIIEIEITENSIILDMEYPFIFENPKEKTKFEIKDFYFNLNRKIRHSIDQDNDFRVIGEHNIFSSDNGFQMIIQDNTLISDKDGKPIIIDMLYVDIIEIKPEYPKSMIGGVLYDIYPHEVFFNPALTIKFRYPLDYLISLGNHFTLSYFDEEIGWVDVPTEIDLENNYLVGNFSYLP